MEALTLKDEVASSELCLIDISAFPVTSPRGSRRLSGRYLARCRTANASRLSIGASVSRGSLTEAHGSGHKIIPWHEAAFQLDDEECLLGMTRDQLEDSCRRRSSSKKPSAPVPVRCCSLEAPRPRLSVNRFCADRPGPATLSFH